MVIAFSPAELYAQIGLFSICKQFLGLKIGKFELTVTVHNNLRKYAFGSCRANICNICSELFERNEQRLDGKQVHLPLHYHNLSYKMCGKIRTQNYLGENITQKLINFTRFYLPTNMQNNNLD